eukprot:1797098-Pleurochrysis_carterae.AAC.1
MQARTSHASAALLACTIHATRSTHLLASRYLARIPPASAWHLLGISRASRLCRAWRRRGVRGSPRAPGAAA